MSDVALDLFAEHTPHRPYSAECLGYGLRVRRRAQALRYPHIQYNPPSHVCWLVVDVDKPHSAAHILDNAPPPAWIAINDTNGHAHAAYGLQTPVCRTERARLEPLRYLAHVERGLTAAIGGDAGFAHLITKNPLHEHWRVLSGIDGRSGIYQLGELAEYIPHTLPANEIIAGTGRNVELFERLSHWAYTAIRKMGWPEFDTWHAAVLRQAQANNLFDSPLPYAEIKAIARSVARWTYKRFSEAGFSQWQAERGRRKGAKRRDELMPAVLDMKAQGASQRLIGDTLGIDQKTVGNWLRGIRS